MQRAMHKAEALIFDMDGTMVDSMPWHARAWIEYGRRKGLAIDVPDFMRRTTGRTAFECTCELAGPHVIAAVRDYNEHAHSNFLETFDAVA